MPNLSDVSLLTMKRMMLTTYIETYVVLEDLRDGKSIDRDRHADILVDLIGVEWVAEVEGALVLTDAGRRHLAAS